MAHSRLRKDNICLNCGTVVPDRYCPHCGQENIEPNDSIKHLIGHFFEDITHYDSKFFRFFKYLFFRPGYLTRQYIAGHRASHLNPIRAYIFISFVFFLVLFSGKKEEIFQVKDEQAGIEARQQLAESLRNTATNAVSATTKDSVKIALLNEIATSMDSAITNPEKEQSVGFNLSTEGIAFRLKDTRYRNLKEYDSVQNSLPDTSGMKDKGFFVRWIVRTNLRLQDKYGSRTSVVLAQNFAQSVPKVMFVLLPIFAIYLLMFFHRNKKYHYAQHVIFSIHYHSFVFLLFMVRMFLSWVFHYEWFVTSLQLLTLFLMFLYLVLAMKNTYGQSLWLSLLKGLGITVLYGISMIIAIFLLAAGTFFLG